MHSTAKKSYAPTISSSKYQKGSHKIQETKMLSFNQPLVLESSTAIFKKKMVGPSGVRRHMLLSLAVSLALSPDAITLASVPVFW